MPHRWGVNNNATISQTSGLADKQQLSQYGKPSKNDQPTTQTFRNPKSEMLYGIKWIPFELEIHHAGCVIQFPTV